MDKIFRRATPGRSAGTSANSGTQWPHVTSQDLYNIQMAFVRNHGFGAQRIELGPQIDPMMRVTDPRTHAVMTMKVSCDGLNWEVTGSGDVSLVEPLDTNCADLADRIVDAIRNPC
jgi:hypothetical protein